MVTEGGCIIVVPVLQYLVKYCGTTKVLYFSAILVKSLVQYLAQFGGTVL